MKNATKKRKLPMTTQKLKVLKEMDHTLLHTVNYQQIKDFYYTALKKLKIAEESWRNKKYLDP